MNKTGGNKLQTTAVKNEESKMEAAKAAQSTMSAPPADQKNELPDPLSPQSALAALQSDVQPVGHDYVEEVRRLYTVRKKKVPIVVIKLCS